MYNCAFNYRVAQILHSRSQDMEVSKVFMYNYINIIE